MGSAPVRRRLTVRVSQGHVIVRMLRRRSFVARPLVAPELSGARSDDHPIARLISSDTQPNPGSYTCGRFFFSGAVIDPHARRGTNSASPTDEVSMQRSLSRPRRPIESRPIPPQLSPGAVGRFLGPALFSVAPVPCQCFAVVPALWTCRPRPPLRVRVPGHRRPVAKTRDSPKRPPPGSERLEVVLPHFETGSESVTRPGRSD
jgi:hypothetical protein